MSVDGLFILHLVITAFLCGLIWVVQLVHYPLFALADRDDWAEFAAAHRRRVSWVVMPTMIGEFLSGVALLPAISGAGPLTTGLATVNLALLAGIWASTALLQVPAHRRLEARFDADAHKRLVRSNWLRTVLWTVRTLGLLMIAWTDGVGIG